MKALVLAGGRGKRLESHTRDVHKCMLELAGKPLIQYSFDHCVAIAPEEIVVVVGHLAEQIVNRYGNSYRGIPIRYAIQREQRGLVHAIETAAPQLGGSDFMLFLADEVLLEPDHAAMLERFRAGGVFAVCGVTQPRDRDAIRKTYAILDDGRGRILRLIEKPRRALNEYQGTGNIVLSRRVLDYIESTPIHPVRQEKELPDLIQCAIDDGHVVQACLVGGRYVNVNTPEDIALAEQELATYGVRRQSPPLSDSGPSPRQACESESGGDCLRTPDRAGMPREPEEELMNDAALAEAYAAADLTELHQPLVAEFRRRFPSFAAGRLLDLGCGTADVTIRFARALDGVTCHGVDGSRAMLACAGRAVESARLTSRVTLEERLLPDHSLERGAFDAVISNSLLHHLADPHALWRTIVRCARPRAAVMVADLHRPPDIHTARELVARHGSDAPPILQQSFFDSLRAAYTADEIRRQLDDAGLADFRVERIDDVHILVWGDAPTER